MKRSFLACSLAVAATFFSFAANAQDAETYKLDPSHTYVLWSVNHLGFSSQPGKFAMVDGTLTLDQAKPENSKVDVVINTDNLMTGVPKLDEHLKNKDFFNVKRFPKATFVSDKVEVTGQNSAKVYGMLTLLGVSKPVVLDVKLNKSGMHPITNKQSVGFTATTTIKRSDFGMNYGLPAVGDEVKIDIGAEANSDKK